MEIDLARLHHAYLIVGETGDGEEYLSRLFSRMGVGEVGNPDLLRFYEESFGIDEARRLAGRALERAFGEKKVFVISSPKITLEAQNALLKTFEEPSAHTHFFVIAREEGAIIPTLRSRMSLVKLGTKNSDLESPREFISMSFKDRIEFAKEFEGDLGVFLDSLLEELRKSERVRSVSELRKYAGDRSASSRLILEHLALVLP